MSMLLKGLAWIAPQAALWRAYALSTIDAQRGYDGAARGRRGTSFDVGKGAANTQVGPALARLRDRSSDMVRNTWLGARMLDVLVAHVIGTGITVAFDDAKVQALWDEWCVVAATDGERDFAGVQALALRAALERGDSAVRMVPRRLNGNALPVPLQLQVLEGDFIDETRDGLLDGRRTRLGVVLGDFDERLGYWLHAEHPGEMTIGAMAQSSHVARGDLCHLYRALRPGQVRGVPLLSPVLLTARDYADLMDAMIVKARMEACYGLLISSNNPVTNLAGATTRTDTADPKGHKVEEMRPGMIFRGAPGDTVTAMTPSGSGQFEPVSLSALMGIASGGMVTYDQLTGDLRRANYSSLRAGKIEFRRLVEQCQWLDVVPLLLNRVVARWKDLAVLSGRLRARKAGYRHSYVMPAVEPIDPLKDLQADILAVRAGRMSPQEFIGAWGRDWRQVVAEIGEFWKEADAAGLVLDIDPRRVNRVGQAQSFPTDEPASSASKD